MANTYFASRAAESNFLLPKTRGGAILKPTRPGTGNGENDRFYLNYGGVAVMHVVLLMVGAHAGEIRRDNILQAAAKGFVILIEPVPFLFARLSQAYAGLPNITCLNCCVSPRSGEISFFAPTEEATKVCPWGDQLGSMSADHAVGHNHELSAYIEEIQVEALTFPQIIEKFDITSLDVLFTDTEGYDTTLLPHFPFDRLLPKRIVFEYKHADGTFNIGRNLGKLLIMLDELGYDMRIMDDENCLAARRAVVDR